MKSVGECLPRPFGRELLIRLGRIALRAMPIVHLAEGRGPGDCGAANLSDGSNGYPGLSRRGEGGLAGWTGNQDFQRARGPIADSTLPTRPDGEFPREWGCFDAAPGGPDGDFPWTRVRGLSRRRAPLPPWPPPNPAKAVVEHPTPPCHRNTETAKERP